MKRQRYSIIYVLHVMPEEIQDVGRLIKDFEITVKENPSVDITLYIDLNLSDTYFDWSNSKMTLETCYHLFTSYLLQARRNLNIVHNVKRTGQWGVNSTRRSAIIEYKDKFDYIGFIDCDIFFDPNAVEIVYKTLEKVEGEFVIFSGLLPKMWNEHFDGLTHPKFEKVTDRSFPFKIDPLSVYNFHKTQKNNIGFTSEVIIGGGWFNIFSSTIFDYIEIPSELGVYGIDDHWIQECCKFLNSSGWDIKQCYNDKFIVLENHGRKFHLPDPFLVKKRVNGGKHQYVKEAQQKYETLFDRYKQEIIKKYF